MDSKKTGRVELTQSTVYATSIPAIKDDMLEMFVFTAQYYEK
jgi:hypothetical protein